MILVTGGTGMVGSHLLFSLISNNKPVKATFRKGSDLSKVKKIFSYYTDDSAELFKKINWIEADITDVPALENAFNQVNTVYHCAALISFNPKEYNTLYKINVEGTANIVNLCIAKNIEKLCYVSSIATIDGYTTNTIVTEETEWNDAHANVYALTKYDAEMEVWRSTQENLSVVIVNPGVIVGPGFWNTGSGVLFKTAAKGSKYYPPGGTGFIAVNDVVKMMISLMDSNTTNERYIAIAENISYKDILSKITKQLNITAPTKKLAFWQLNILARLDGLRTFFTNTDRKLTKETIFSLKNRQEYSNNKIRTAQNFKFEAIDEIVKFCCALYKKENTKK